MIIRDFTDNDLYKFTTMNAILKKFPGAEVIYQFIDRGNNSFPEGFALALRNEIDCMKDLTLSPEAEEFITERCFYFEPSFIAHLRNYRFNPSEVTVRQTGGKLEVIIQGAWHHTVLWEVPILAIISELYYKMTGQAPSGFEEKAIAKSKEFALIGASVSEFGTRRRFSFDVQDKVIALMKEHMGSYLSGTSNLYLAMKHNLPPVGTHPHEWFMYHGTHYGCLRANAKSLEHWVEVYNGNLGIALTDTYTTDNFFKNFNKKYSVIFNGLRWDSGDPFLFTDKALNHYAKMNIDATTKTIVYSDYLNLERVKQIKAYVASRINDVYGIGTYLTNDVGVQPLNMVIKMTSAKPSGFNQFIPSIKLSDVKEKYTGEAASIEEYINIIKEN